MEMNRQRQGLGGWWQRCVERVKDAVCPRHIVDPMPPLPWELLLLLPVLACGLAGVVWLIAAVWRRA